MSTLEDRLFAELDDHLNNGCIDSRCMFNPSSTPGFDNDFLNHLVDVLMETFSEETNE